MIRTNFFRKFQVKEYLFLLRRSVILILTFGLPLWAGEAALNREQLRLKLTEQFRSLKSFTADFVAIKSENTHKIHIRLIYNAAEKFILFKINNINSNAEKPDYTGDQRTFLLLDFQTALNQYYIFPEKKEIWRYSTDNILNDPFNVYMVGLNLLNQFINKEPLVLRFDQFAPTFNLELKPGEINCFLGVDVMSADLMASWLRPEVFNNAESIRSHQGQISIRMRAGHELRLDDRGMFLSEKIQQGDSLRSISRVAFQEREIPRGVILPEMSMYSLKQQFNPEFRQSLLSIMTFLSGVYFSKMEKEVARFHQQLDSLKPQLKKYLHEKFLILMKTDSQMRQFSAYLVSDFLYKDFEEESSGNAGVDFSQYLKNLKKNYLEQKKELANKVVAELIRSIGQNWASLEGYEPYIEQQTPDMQFQLRDFYKNFYRIYSDVIYLAFFEAVCDFAFLKR